MATTTVKHETLVGKVALCERPPFHSPAVAGIEVIQYNGLMSGPGQGLSGVASDITGAAGDEYAHVEAPGLSDVRNKESEGGSQESDSQILALAVC